MLQLLPYYLSNLHATHDEDSVDRINYIYTNVLLLGFSILLTAKQYVGRPLQCWVPAQFKSGWEVYVENHCFIENTYFVRMDEQLPDSGDERQKRELAYYQWIPFILAMQAAFCYAPRIVWKVFNRRSGIELAYYQWIPFILAMQAAFCYAPRIVWKVFNRRSGMFFKFKHCFQYVLATTVLHVSFIDFNRTASLSINLTQFIPTALATMKVGKKKVLKDNESDYSALVSRIEEHVSLANANRVHFGMYVTILYLIVKFLWLVNVVVQFLILNIFLGPQYTLWGIGIVNDLLHNRDWSISGHFPRIKKNVAGINLTQFIPTALATMKVGKKKVLKDNESDYSALVSRIEEHVSLANANRVHFGMYVTILYLIVKFLWLVNVVVQFLILNIFLGPQYTLWGIGIVNDLLHNRDWSISGHFPRVTLCDVEVREMGNLHNWTVQCVLMINMFAEKIFLFLWFWFCFVAIATSINFVYWIFVSLSTSQSRAFVRKYLEFKDKKGANGEKIDRFISNALRKDGITVLRLISENCGDLAVAEIVCKLWDAYDNDAERFTEISEESDAGYLEDFQEDYGSPEQ
ncbi:Innexin unc-7 [Toxocara canis]|uniref:Innexin n=1 Tax=Toxocara canis TaxID=6265 RepID=A0A0B2V6Q0_TOXCA|nr:Innexin unc-7 [Toxocara canis]